MPRTDTVCPATGEMSPVPCTEPTLTTALVQAGGGAPTVTVAVRLSTVPPGPVTRTQYDVVAVSAGVVNDGALVPTGVLVSPATPVYHW